MVTATRMVTALTGLTRWALRVAVRRWPPHMRADMSAEWNAELHAIVGALTCHPTQSGSDVRASWRGLRFAASLAWSRPPGGQGEADGLASPVRWLWKPLLAGTLGPVLWLVVGVLTLSATQFLPPEIRFPVMVLTAGTVGALVARWTARRTASRPVATTGPAPAFVSSGLVSVMRAVVLPAVMLVALEWALSAFDGRWAGAALTTAAGVACWAVLTGIAGWIATWLARRGWRLVAMLASVGGAYLACLIAELVRALPLFGSGIYALQWQRWLLLEPWFVANTNTPRLQFVSLSAADMPLPSLLAGSALFAVVYLMTVRKAASRA